MSRGRKRRGFTLVEALASVVLLAVGIVASERAMASIARDEAGARTRERLTALAANKLDELLVDATAQSAGDTSGDFADRGAQDVTWTFTVGASGVQNLNTARLVVRPRGADASAPQAVLSTLLYAPPATAGAPTP